jgi:acyl-CoA thioester hydrolase
MDAPGALPIGHLPATIAKGRHRYTVRVYFEDTDAGGIVYHATYLRFAERGRTEALRDLGVPHSELVSAFNLMFVVRRIKMDYFRPARLDDRLTVTTQPLFVGGASVTLRQGFERAGEAAELAVAIVKLGCVGPGTNRPERMPDRWRCALESLHAAGQAATGGEQPRGEGPADS